MAQEGNFKLFAKQVVVVAVVALILYYLSGKFEAEIQKVNGQLESIHAQQASEQEYLANKKLLISLEPRFASIESKNTWLKGQVIDIFKKAKLAYATPNEQVEDSSNPAFLAVALQANASMDFETFGNLLADIENRGEYVKISGFILEKDTDPNRMGNNRVSIKLNTVFPKEKIAKSMFKDYDQLVAEHRKEKSAKRKVKKGK